MRAEYFVKFVTAEQKANLREHYTVTDWHDGSVNVNVDEDDVDGFIEWCEDQELFVQLL